MSAVPIEDLKSDAEGLLRRVEAGETIIVTRGDEVVAEIKPIQSPPKGKRPYGLAAGEFEIPADFDAPLPDDLLDAFQGR